MSKHPPPYAYVLTVGFGILAFIISIMLPSVVLPSVGMAFSFQKILLDVAVYLSFGIVVGLLWPMLSWKCGIWLAVPWVLLIGFSVLFAGYVGVFLQKDLPFLIAILISGGLGGLIGSRLRGMGQRLQASDNGNADE